MTDLRLSPQQEAACYYVVRGETDENIAVHLRCSPRTVRFHIESAAKRIATAHGWVYRRPRKVIHRYYVDRAGDSAFQRPDCLPHAA